MANEKKIPPGLCSNGTTSTINPNEISNRKPSCYGGLLPMGLPQPLLLEEKKYLLAVERGDIANVRRVLQRAHRKKHININCMDPLGRRALTLAIDSENLEMVELLVVMGVETKDSLLHAIDAEFVEAVELLLEHEELIYTEGDLYSWQKVDINTAMFAPDITPLILAAHKNNFEILKLLLDRGAAVPTPHDIKCGCEECVRHSTEDALRFSLARVNTYKALASPSFISLTSHDPLMTAFELSWDLRNLAFTEQECKAEYLELRRQCQQFAVDLLDQTRTSEELAIIINYDPAHSYEPGDRMTLSLLEQAISYKQKKFVAHPNVQQLLAAIWYQGLPGFRRKTEVQKVLKIIQVAIMFPLYCFIYMIAPNSDIGKLMRKPFMKFLIHASSYLFFLFILILVSQRAEDDVVRLFGTDDMIDNLEKNSEIQRGKGPTKLELIVVCYLAGFLWEELQEIFNVGMKSYLRNMWNFIDFLRNGLYISVFCLRVFAYIDQQSEIERDPSQAKIPREKWDDFDPQLIAEGLFAGANIFSALKLVHLFSINPHLGPLQISLGRMVIDIVKFFFIYTLVLFAFACGLNQLLWYFADLEKNKCYNGTSEADWKENGDSCMKWRRFGNLFESSQSLFWASFGMVGLENFELSGIKSYTRFWGLLMYGSYSVINVIVLLNLLIAMMSNSYAMIELHSDTEWKFARTKLWMSYFEDSSTLPPPFNVFPSIKWVIRLFRKSSKELARKKSQKRGENKTENRYASIMWSLVWRYVSANHRRLEQAPVTEDDINEVKADISTMRYELLEIFDSNGMDVSSAAKKEKPHRAKHAKIWERRLMRGFQVAPVPTAVASKSPSNNVNVNGEGDINEIKIESEPNQQPVREDPKTRFRRIAHTVANQSAVHKWNLVLQGVAKNSQIGRCCSKESYNSLQHLQKAIGEAKRLVLLSPPPHGTGCETPVIEFEDEKTSTLLDLLNKIGAELTGTDEANEDSDITNAKSVHKLVEDVSSSSKHQQATNPMPPDIHPVITEYGFISPPQSLKHDAVVAKMAKESHPNHQQRKTPPVDTNKSTTTKSQNEVILSAASLGSSRSSGAVGIDGAAELLLRNADAKMLAGKAIKKNPPPPAPGAQVAGGGATAAAASASTSAKGGSNAAKSTPKPPILSKLSSSVHPSHHPPMQQDSFEVSFFEMDDAMEEMYSAGLTDSQSEASSIALQPPPKPASAPKSPYKRGTGRQGWF